MLRLGLFFAVLLHALPGFGQSVSSANGPFDVLIRNGLVYDGSGGKPVTGDVGIRGDQVVAVGKLTGARAKTVIDAKGMAVAPGFINVLSHAGDKFLVDGRSLSDLKQGVTTEIFGESSWGPLRTKALQQEMSAEMKRMGQTRDWVTLGQFLKKLEKKGISANVASYVSAGVVRINVLGEEDVRPTAGQMTQMRALVREAMEEGALGVTSALIYPPYSFATTEELIGLCQEAARYGGRYIVHIRSEGDRLEEGIAETIRIGREARLPVEVYHLKAAGYQNWPKMEAVFSQINAVRKEGVAISTDMYTYTAGATGLTVCLPPYLFNGGFMAGWKRLQDPETRKKVAAEVRQPNPDWENFFQKVRSPDEILLAEFQNDSLKKYAGKTLAQVAAIRKKDPVETIIDLIVEDKSRVEVIYYLMSEENVKKCIVQPWMTFGSDAGSMAVEWKKAGMQHPRAFGNFARLLGHYVRDEKVISLEEAIRRLTSLPATQHKLPRRGLLRPGYFADVVVFDPATIADKATFADPFQYAVGVQHVWVNGRQVLRQGEHTNVFPGRALWGPGKRPKASPSKAK